ncbi:glutamine amidotransferase [Methanolinea mesophila]|uniref:imidazole glycerol phosphate synthase subunit HisH n=1 Tax=Methanolinea mesophila TaxID=547055 RepID=UPI001AE3783B|nr:imidazole glycerol phosphate synthase subunit HisH [Methanolinea mesophila]MBP1929655.1 glutamine amidotransferase [Methanolinea mesophila]
MKKIIIIDYGLGNLRSVYRGLEKSGAAPLISSDPGEIGAAEGIVLPGVGAFRDGMEQLGEMKETLLETAGKVPVLGICLGMQMLLDWSEEHGMHRGLSLIPGTVRRFPRKKGYKIPHMGWNSLRCARDGDPLLEGLTGGEYVYFVHSFYADPDPGYSVATTDYICNFSSVIGKGRVYGVQFHPEKSGSVGIRILKNFIDMVE